MKIRWTETGWRVDGLLMSFCAKCYKDAFFFVKYEADIDTAFMLDYILND